LAEKEITTSKDQKISISLSKFLKYHLAMQRMVVRVAYEKLSSGVNSLSFSHWQEIDDLIKNRPVGSIVDLSKKIGIKKTSDCLVVFKK